MKDLYELFFYNYILEKPKGKITYVKYLLITKTVCQMNLIKKMTTRKNLYGFEF